jgi:hypothetical protein
MRARPIRWSTLRVGRRRTLIHLTVSADVSSDSRVDVVTPDDDQSCAAAM